jgi:hypothetical protein
LTCQNSLAGEILIFLETPIKSGYLQWHTFCRSDGNNHFFRKAKRMNSKSILTKITLVVSVLLMLQPAFAQIGKSKKAMTPEQIEAFLKVAQKKGWQVTVKTQAQTFSGKVDYVWAGERVSIVDLHPMTMGPCTLEINAKTEKTILLQDIISVGKRNLFLLGLRNTGEVSASVGFIALALPFLPFQIPAMIESRK